MPERCGLLFYACIFHLPVELLLWLLLCEDGLQSGAGGEDRVSSHR